MNIESLLFSAITDKKHEKELREELRLRILKQKRFFLIANPKTTAEEWQRKTFAAYVSPEKKLCVFLNTETAERFAEKTGAILAGNTPMVMASTLSALQKLAETYQDIATHICFYVQAPLYIDYPCSEVFKTVENPIVLETTETPPSVSTAVVPASSQSKEYIGVVELKAMLDCADKSKISNLSSYSIYEKFPYILQKLMAVNKLKNEDVNEALGLPDGLLNQIQKESKIDLSKVVLKNILNYFGLQNYLYRYADSSSELLAELNSNTKICRYKIQPAKVSTKERFTLDDIKRAIDVNDAFIYRIIMQSKVRQQILIVTSPVPLLKGKEYEIVGLDPACDESDSNTVSNTVHAVSSDEGIAVMEKMKKKFEQSQRGYLDQRKDTIIAHFKYNNPQFKVLQLKDVEALYLKLSEHDDLLDEFFWKLKGKSLMETLGQDEEFQRRKSEQAKDVEVQGYTATGLQKEFGFKPWESYFWLVDLRKDPQKTKQRLVYRKNDPQYQKK